MQESLTETKYSLTNTTLHDIQSKKISFEFLYNMPFLFLSDSVVLLLLKAKWKN